MEEYLLKSHIRLRCHSWHGSPLRPPPQGSSSQPPALPRPDKIGVENLSGARTASTPCFPYWALIFFKYTSLNEDKK